MSYVVVDIETTGLSKTRHKITEIAALRVQKGMVKDEFHTLVNPEARIPSFITRLTGIDNELVKDAPTIKEVMPQFTDFMGNDILVAHNASFDHGFLMQNAMKAGLDFDNYKLCTRKLANRLLPELPTKKLGALCEHFSITNIQAHRAKADALATVGVFNQFCNMLEEQNISTPEQIMLFERSPRKRL